MTEFTGQIKEKIGLYPLIDNLVAERMISEAEKARVTDQSNGWDNNQRMDGLLRFVKASIENEDDFYVFIDIIKQENTRRVDRLVDKLSKAYEKYSAKL